MSNKERHAYVVWFGLSMIWFIIEAGLIHGIYTIFTAGYVLLDTIIITVVIGRIYQASWLRITLLALAELILSAYFVGTFITCSYIDCSSTLYQERVYIIHLSILEAVHLITFWYTCWYNKYYAIVNDDGYISTNV